MPRPSLAALLSLLLPIVAVYFGVAHSGYSFTDVLNNAIEYTQQSGQGHQEPVHAPLPTPTPSTGAQRTSFKRKIVAVGDLHGDLANARKVLQMSGVTDVQHNWSGDIDIFVQTGDIVDRGDDTLLLFDWMEELREQAIGQGGETVSLLGNHEWMNLIMDWRYVPSSEIKTFGGQKERQDALGAKGVLGKRWASANYSTTARVPLHPHLGITNKDFAGSAHVEGLSHSALSFVHGGLAPNYPDLSPYPSAINALSSSLINKLQSRNPVPGPHPPKPYPGLPHDTTLAEDGLYGSEGPLWYRGWARSPAQDEETVCREVEQVLKKIGCRRMIMGHTPDFEKIVSRCGGKIIIIDTGISHAYGGTLSALSIEYSLEPLPSSATKWKERETVTAIYEHHEVLLAEDTAIVEGDYQASHVKKVKQAA